MDHPLEYHLPLISKRIEFQLQCAPDDSSIGPLPEITHRINFSSKLHDVASHNTLNPNDAEMEQEHEREQAMEEQDEHFVDNTTPNDHHDDEGSTGTDYYEEAQSDFSNQETLIAKPAGEAGRPGCGGYSLIGALKGWTPEDYRKINDWVKTEAQKSLDVTLSYKKQDTEHISTICAAAAQKFLIIKKYRNHWPIRDMLKGYLKYESEKSRKAAL